MDDGIDATTHSSRFCFGAFGACRDFVRHSRQDKKADCGSGHECHQEGVIDDLELKTPHEQPRFERLLVTPSGRQPKPSPKPVFVVVMTAEQDHGAFKARQSATRTTRRQHCRRSPWLREHLQKPVGNSSRHSGYTAGGFGDFYLRLGAPLHAQRLSFVEDIKLLFSCARVPRYSARVSSTSSPSLRRRRGGGLGGVQGRSGGPRCGRSRA